MLHTILNKLDAVVGFESASAHCDIPCKIYDPSTAQVAALTRTSESAESKGGVDPVVEPHSGGPSVLTPLPCTNPVAPQQPRGLGCTLVDTDSLTAGLKDSGSSDRRLGWGTTEEAAAPLVPLPASTKIDSLNSRRLTSRNL